MEELEQALQRHERRKKHQEEPADNKISKTFTKILLSVILVLSCTIYIKLSEENKEFFKKNVMENNLAFAKINTWYHNTFGNLLPSVTEPSSNVVSSTNVVETKEKYLDGYKITTTKNAPIASISGGLLVFMGEKEGYGNTLIIQGMDGIDIWYGGLTDTNLKLYDYIDAETILGLAQEDFYYVAFQKNGEFLNYEDATQMET